MTFRVRAAMSLLVGFMCACVLACGFSQPAFARVSEPTPSSYFNYSYVDEDSPAATYGAGVYIWRLSNAAYEDVDRVGGIVLPKTLEVDGVEYPVVAVYLSAEGLGSLDASQCESLRYLECWGSLDRGSTLKVAGCAKLERLDCGHNKLESLDLSGCASLDYLDCSHNELTSLDLDGVPLKAYFDCSYNNFSNAVLETVGKAAEDAADVITSPQCVNVDTATITFGSCVYDGRNWYGNYALNRANWRTPNISISVGEVALKEDVHYAFDREGDARRAGTYDIRVYGLNDFNGEVNTTFTIQKAPLKASMVSLSAKAFVYDGTAKKPAVTVSVNGVKQYASEYEVTYWDHAGKRVAAPKAVGTYTVRVGTKASANTEGVVKKTFVINPPRTSIKSLSSLDNGIKVKWQKKSAGIDGYQIMYSTKRSFGTYGMKKVANPATVVKSLKGLKDKRYYYVKMRTYNAVGGKTLYSTWTGTWACSTK